MEAALLIRSSGVDAGNVEELFWSDGKLRVLSFRIAAEMIVDAQVKDDFGRPAEATSTFLRYEVRIGYEAPTAKGLVGRLFLQSETLDYITESEAAGKLRFPHNASHFRKAVVYNKRRTASGFISVRQAEDGQTEILVHQDGGSRGPAAQTAPAMTAPRTIVATQPP